MTLARERAVMLALAALSSCTVEFPGRADRPTDAGPGDASLHDTGPGEDARGSKDARPGGSDATAGALDDGSTPHAGGDGSSGDARSGPPKPDGRATDGGSAGDGTPSGTEAGPGDGSADSATDAGADGAAPCVVPVPELCNGEDDDCNGLVDDAAGCGVYVATHCRAWLGWADQAMPIVSDTWGGCPAAQRDVDRWHGQNVVCNSSHGDGRFHPVPFAGDVDETDSLGVAFTCDPQAGPVSAWVETHCRVFLGQADVVGDDVLPNDAQVWGACPAANDGPDPSVPCVGSGGDGRFHAMRLVGDVNSDDRFAIAFRCEANADEGEAGRRRAEMLTAAVRVFLAYSADFWVRESLTYDEWGDCPGVDRDDEADYRCVSSGRDGRFHALHLGTFIDPDLDADDMFGVAMVASD